MSYRIDLHEKPKRELRRVAQEELSAAIEAAESSEDLHESIHEVRKRGKKVRALLRLYRKATPDLYAKENTELRDLARELSELRDAHALVELVEGPGEVLRARDPVMYASLRKGLVHRQDTLYRKRDAKGMLARAAKGLREARERADQWSLSAKGFDAFEGGLRKTYGRGRDRADEIVSAMSAKSDLSKSRSGDEATPPEALDTHALHDLRKRVKYHRYHIDLLAEIWPVLFESHENALHDMSDVLGLDQDAQRLRRVVAEDSRFTPETSEAVERWAAEVREDLERSLARVQAAFTDKPKAFVRRALALYSATDCTY